MALTASTVHQVLSCWGCSWRWQLQLHLALQLPVCRKASLSSAMWRLSITRWQVDAGGVHFGAAATLNEVRSLCRKLCTDRKLHSMAALAVLARQLDHWSGNQVQPGSTALVTLECQGSVPSQALRRTQTAGQYRLFFDHC